MTASRSIAPWWFPVTYGVHIAEEYHRGVGFPRWFSEVFGTALSGERFLAINAVAFAAVTIGAIVSSTGVGRDRVARWYLPAVATAFAINGTAHLLATLWLGRYAPGAFSGGLIWLPMGLGVLWLASREWSWARLRAPMALGIALHMMVTGIALIGA